MVLVVVSTSVVSNDSSTPPVDCTTLVGVNNVRFVAIHDENSLKCVYWQMLKRKKNTGYNIDVFHAAIMIIFYSHDISYDYKTNKLKSLMNQNQNHYFYGLVP